MRFADIRTEWRVEAIENNMRGKAESYQVEQVRSDVGSLEHSMREVRSVCDGLRSELEMLREEMRIMRSEFDEARWSKGEDEDNENN